MNFQELRVNKFLLKALDELEFVYPTPIQRKTFRRITAGRDVVGIAPTGTGKTFAYLLPLLGMLEFSKEKHPRALIVLPTRELVLQVKDEAVKLCKYKNLRIKEVYGGANIKTQIEYLHDGGVDIIIGTPGRIFDIAVTGIIRFSNIKKLVIDEVDELLSLGFRPQLEQILDILPIKRQNLMFSSTLDKEIEEFINKYFFEPEIIRIEDENPPIERIRHLLYEVPNINTKIELLKFLLSNNEFSKTLIFVSGKKLADYTYDKLTEEGIDNIGVLHSNKAQNNRFNTIKLFEKGKIKALIATDIVSRGLDFKEVSHVIHLTVPESYNDFIHRVGRTGRAGAGGTEILMISSLEKQPEFILDIPFEKIEIPEGLSVSTVLLEEEKQFNQQKNSVRVPDIKKGGGAFHEVGLKKQRIHKRKK